MYKFFYSGSDGSVEHIVHADVMTWMEVVDRFQDFLYGRGFVMPPKSVFNMSDILESAFYDIKDAQDNCDNYQ